MKRLLILVLVLGVAGLGVSGGWFLAKPTEAAVRLAAAQGRLQETDLKIERLEAEVKRLKAELAAKPVLAEKPATTVASGKATPAGSGQAADAPATKAGAESTAEAMRKMMSEPGMREMMKKSMGIQIEMGYGGLFDQFGLTKEERQHFKQLLADRAMAGSDFGMKMMDPALTSEQRAALRKDFEAAKKASDGAIKAFLNEDADYTEFQAWEELQPDRMQFQMMGKAAFAASREPLTPDQERQLIAVMGEVRKQPTGLPDLNDPAQIAPDALSDEAVNRQMQAMQANARKVAERAAAFLTPGQLETLAEVQDQVNSMTETGLRMSGKMFGTTPQGK